MPYRDPNRQREIIARSVRRLRLYRKAVAAGDPRALAIEELRDGGGDPMRPYKALAEKIARLPQAERHRLKTAPASEPLSAANVMRVYQECLDARERREAVGAEGDPEEYRRQKAAYAAELEMLS